MEGFTVLNPPTGQPASGRRPQPPPPLPLQNMRSGPFRTPHHAETLFFSPASPLCPGSPVHRPSDAAGRFPVDTSSAMGSPLGVLSAPSLHSRESRSPHPGSHFPETVGVRGGLPVSPPMSGKHSSNSSSRIHPGAPRHRSDPGKKLPSSFTTMSASSSSDSKPPTTLSTSTTTTTGATSSSALLVVAADGRTTRRSGSACKKHKKSAPKQSKGVSLKHLPLGAPQQFLQERRHGHHHRAIALTPREAHAKELLRTLQHPENAVSSHSSAITAASSSLCHHPLHTNRVAHKGTTVLGLGGVSAYLQQQQPPGRPYRHRNTGSDWTALQLLLGEGEQIDDLFIPLEALEAQQQQRAQEEAAAAAGIALDVTAQQRKGKTNRDTARAAAVSARHRHHHPRHVDAAAAGASGATSYNLLDTERGATLFMEIPTPRPHRLPPPEATEEVGANDFSSGPHANAASHTLAAGGEPSSGPLALTAGMNQKDEGSAAFSLAKMGQRIKKTLQKGLLKLSPREQHSPGEDANSARNTENPLLHGVAASGIDLNDTHVFASPNDTQRYQRDSGIATAPPLRTTAPSSPSLVRPEDVTLGLNAFAFPSGEGSTSQVAALADPSDKRPRTEKGGVVSDLSAETGSTNDPLHVRVGGSPKPRPPACSSSAPTALITSPSSAASTTPAAHHPRVLHAGLPPLRSHLYYEQDGAALTEKAFQEKEWLRKQQLQDERQHTNSGWNRSGVTSGRHTAPPLHVRFDPTFGVPLLTHPGISSASASALLAGDSSASNLVFRHNYYSDQHGLPLRTQRQLATGGAFDRRRCLRGDPYSVCLLTAEDTKDLSPEARVGGRGARGGGAAGEVLGGAGDGDGSASAGGAATSTNPLAYRYLYHKMLYTMLRMSAFLAFVACGAALLICIVAFTPFRLQGIDFIALLSENTTSIRTPVYPPTGSRHGLVSPSASTTVRDTPSSSSQRNMWAPSGEDRRLPRVAPPIVIAAPPGVSRNRSVVHNSSWPQNQLVFSTETGIISSTTTAANGDANDPLALRLIHDPRASLLFYLVSDAQPAFFIFFSMLCILFHLASMTAPWVDLYWKRHHKRLYRTLKAGQRNGLPPVGETLSAGSGVGNAVTMANVSWKRHFFDVYEKQIRDESKFRHREQLRLKREQHQQEQRLRKRLHTRRNRWHLRNKEKQHDAGLREKGGDMAPPHVVGDAGETVWVEADAVEQRLKTEMQQAEKELREAREDHAKQRQLLKERYAEEEAHAKGLLLQEFNFLAFQKLHGSAHPPRRGLQQPPMARRLPSDFSTGPRESPLTATQARWKMRRTTTVPLFGFDEGGVDTDCTASPFVPSSPGTRRSTGMPPGLPRHAGPGTPHQSVMPPELAWDSTAPRCTGADYPATYGEDPEDVFTENTFDGSSSHPILRRPSVYGGGGEDILLPLKPSAANRRKSRRMSNLSYLYRAAAGLNEGGTTPSPNPRSPFDEEELTTGTLMHDDSSFMSSSAVGSPHLGGGGGGRLDGSVSRRRRPQQQMRAGNAYHPSASSGSTFAYGGKGRRQTSIGDELPRGDDPDGVRVQRYDDSEASTWAALEEEDEAAEGKAPGSGFSHPSSQRRSAYAAERGRARGPDPSASPLAFFQDPHHFSSMWQRLCSRYWSVYQRHPTVFYMVDRILRPRLWCLMLVLVISVIEMGLLSHRPPSFALQGAGQGMWFRWSPSSNTSSGDLEDTSTPRGTGTGDEGLVLYPIAKSDSSVYKHFEVLLTTFYVARLVLLLITCFLDTAL